MSATLERTVLPPVESDKARMLAVVEILGLKNHAVLTSPDGSQLPLPNEVYEALREVVGALAAGRAITIVPHNTVLTTQEAAEMLGISRPTLVKLLEAGKIPYERPGRHRRVLLADLVGYQQRMRVQRKETLDAMTHEAAEDDAYENEDLNVFIEAATGELTP